MNTKLKALVIEDNEVAGHGYERVLVGKAYEVSTLNAVNDATIDEAPKKENTLLKTVGMFIGAPFIALAYIIALPFIGVYHIAKLALEAYINRYPEANGKLKLAGVFAKNIGLFFAAPFIALAYIIALPFVGFHMFAKLALEARARRVHVNS